MRFRFSYKWRTASICLIFHIFFTTPSYSQILRGKVSDELSTDPIAFANIIVKGSSIGAISNQEGNFELDLSKVDNTFTLLISVIGYETVSISCIKADVKDLLSIEMKESIVELDEVVIRHLSAKEILKEFHKNFTTNYYQGPTLIKAFYHSTLSENNKYKHLMEATINLKEFNKRKKRAFQAEITNLRRSNDYRNEKWGEKNNYLYNTIASNPMYGLTDFLDPKKLKFYNLSRLSNTTYNGETVYVVEFIAKKNVQKPLYNAKVYFNSEDFALIKANYEFINDKSQVRSESLKDRTYHISHISGSVHYQKIGKFYIQKFLTYTNGLDIINNVTNDTLSKDVLKDEILVTSSELNSEIELSNPISRWGDIYKKLFVYDADYWDNQIKIPLTQLFKKAIEDLQTYQDIDSQYINNSAGSSIKGTFENSSSGKIDSILTVYNEKALFNGVALITKNDKIIQHKAYGYSDMENKIPLTIESVFDIGSITKQYTTVIVLKLKELGKLELEDKISKYLPEYRHSEITIHELLSHRSGIPTFDYAEKLTNSKWFTTKMETLDIINTFCSGDLEFDPNSEMEYSNSNYLILTAIIEKIENKDYYSVLNDFIFTPLHLTNSYAPDQLPSQKVARGYIADKDYVLEPNWEKSNMKGVGCVYSTSMDLLKWINIFHSNKMLNKKSRDLIKSPISYYEYYNADFGYSWAINRELFQSKYPMFFYGGTSLGFFSMITTVPEEGINIVLLSNTGNFPRIELTKEILKLLN